MLSTASEKALTVLTRVLSGTVASSDNVVRFHAHFYLSKCYAGIGDLSRSQSELQQARYFVKFVDQVSTEAAEVRGELERRVVSGK